ncbi:MAG: type II toxin-antitoxin system PemK/MazF family toxin [Lachnospiraceae bacterium]|nr:type II toxin-antitoxin system PemK/MazF family toxin [Lachnospiraceae bacterium]
MIEFSQGDIVKIEGYRNCLFVIISKNAFIMATGMFHVCPLLPDVPEGPVHISVCGNKGTSGTVICEQIKAIDSKARNCVVVDTLPYGFKIDVSDTVQGVFEYD